MEEGIDNLIKTDAAESGMSRELSDRLQDEFETVTQANLAGIENDYGEMIKMGKMTEADVKKSLDDHRRRFAGKSLESRASFVLGNFFCWLPGGMNRNYYERRKAEGRAGDAEKMEEDGRLVNDLDSTLAELGIKGDQIDSLLKQGGDRESEHEKLLEVYFKMRDKGYDWLTLVR